MKILEELPFNFDADNITAWLANLCQSELTYASNELYKILKVINKQSVNTDDLFLLTDLLTSTALNFSRGLELLFISLPAEGHANSRKLARLNANILRYLALAYVKISEDESADEFHTLSISRAFQIAGLSLRHSAMIHERQSSFLWKKMSELYQIGFSKNLLDQANNETIDELKQYKTINSILKRNLLFSICNPYSLATIEIDKLFAVIEQFSDLLGLKTLYTIDTSRADFYWLYLDQTPPQFIQPGSKINTILHLNTRNLVAFFLSSKFKNPFDGFDKIISRLSKYQNIINSVVISEPIICNLITGFEQSCQILNKQTFSGDVLQKRLHRSIHEISVLDHVELEPFANEPKFVGKNSSNIWQNDNAFENFQIIKVQRATNNFCIAEVTKLNCQLNEPALLSSRDLNLTLGIIRQIQKPVTAGQNTYRILIEKWMGKISCINNDSEFLILITKKDQSLEALLPLNKYASGTRIKTPAGEVLIQNLLEETPYFMHFEIILNP